MPVVEEPVLVRHGESEGNVAASAAQAAGADVIVMEQRDPDVRPPLKPGLARTVRTPNDSEAELLLVRPLGDDLVADLRAIDSRYDAAIACHDLVDTPSGARAACWATYLHAAAGQRLASQVGRVGCLARGAGRAALPAQRAVPRRETWPWAGIPAASIRGEGDGCEHRSRSRWG